MNSKSSFLSIGLIILISIHFIFPAATFYSGFVIRAVDFNLIPLVFYTQFLLRTNRLKLPAYAKIDKLFVNLILLFIVSTFFSANIFNSINAVLDFFRCLIVFFICRVFIFNQIFSSEGILKVLFKVGVVITVIGILQFLTQSDIGFLLKYFGEETSGAYEDINILRIKGTVANTNIFGQWLGLSVLSFSLISYFKEIVFRRKILYLLIYFLALFVMVTTVSRGVLFFSFVSTFVIIALRYNVFQNLGIIFLWIPLLLVVYFLFFYNGLTVVNNFFERNESDDIRVIYIDFGLALLSKFKVIFLGTGLNSLFPALVDYNINTGMYKPWLDHTEITDSIHNAFIKILVETGVISLIVFVRIYLTVLKDALYVWNKARNPLFLALFVGIFIPLNVYNSTISFYVWLPIVIIVAALHDYVIRLKISNSKK